MGVFDTLKAIVGKVVYIVDRAFNAVLVLIFFLLPLALTPDGMSTKEVVTLLAISSVCTIILWLGATWYFTSHKSINQMIKDLNEEKIHEKQEKIEDGVHKTKSRLVWLNSSEIDISNAYSLCFGIFLLSFMGLIVIDGGTHDLRGEDRVFPTCDNGMALSDSKVMDGEEDCPDGEDENPLVELAYCEGLDCNSVGGILAEEYLQNNIQYILLMTGATVVVIPVLLKTWVPIREMKSSTATMERLTIGIFGKASLGAALGSVYSLSLKISDGRTDPYGEAIEYTLALLLFTMLLSFPYIAALNLIEGVVRKRISNFKFSTENYSQIAEMELVELNNGVFEIKLISDLSESPDD